MLVKIIISNLLFIVVVNDIVMLKVKTLRSSSLPNFKTLHNIPAISAKYWRFVKIKRNIMLSLCNKQLKLITVFLQSTLIFVEHVICDNITYIHAKLVTSFFEVSYKNRYLGQLDIVSRYSIDVSYFASRSVTQMLYKNFPPDNISI